MMTQFATLTPEAHVDEAVQTLLRTSQSEFPVVDGAGKPVGVLGNAPRRNPFLRSFPSYNENLSLAKTFAVRERLRIDFRAEAFNIFNRVVFGGPQTSLNSNTFGVISSQANSPRQMQGGLKLYW